MKHFLCFIAIMCFLYAGAMAECGTREEAITILQCNEPYMHTVSRKALEAWKEGDAEAVSFMDVTEEERKDGINKWSAAVQMFQKLYYSDDPFFNETVEGRYMLDVFMTEAELIPHIYHVMPTTEEMDREEAWSLALDTMNAKYNLNFAGLTRNMTVDTHYITLTGDSKDAFWLFHVMLENGDKYAVQVWNGEVAMCQRLEQVEALFEAYTKLCDEKGAFFTWPLDDKVNYAEMLPDTILVAYMEGQDLERCGDLLAIARQGFCWPDEKSIDQHQALKNAVMAVGNKYHQQDGWGKEAEIAFSYFRQDGKSVWRVIFWKTGTQELPGAVVDMDAETGVPFRIERYDATPQSIPYIERL